MKKNRLIIFALILVIITVFAAVLHLNTREEVAEGHLKLTIGEKEVTADLNDFEYEQLSGIRVNGKGEEILMEGEGILMRDLLKSIGAETYKKVRIVADDSYIAEVNVEEVLEDGKVCLFLQEEGGLRLAVFGDENRKRSVSDVVQIIVE
ncbi:MAG: hypothetical protein E7253_11160 [Lachnospiraceae bacterium]|nr:hypothetical protein [Lachnospiraceae bacterium]